MNTIEFKFSENPIGYNDALSLMNERVDTIIAKEKQELIWFLEHKQVYTLGTSAKENEIKEANNIPICKTTRGGKVTYHGPGQRIIYLMLDLKNRMNTTVPDIRCYVNSLEQVIINTLAHFNILGERRQDRIGVWVINPKTKQEEKIAALGIRIKKGVTMHGISLNISPDLNDFNGIIPCGIKEYGVCSLNSLGIKTTMKEVDKILLKEINNMLATLKNTRCKTNHQDEIHNK